MVDAATQTREKKFKDCSGTNNPDLENFVEYKYGFTYPDGDGYPWGEKLRGSTTFRSRECSGEAISANATRCHDCNRLFLACSNARSRHNANKEKGTQKFTPTSAL